MDKTAATILGVSLMIIMLGMGLSLTLEDFKRVLKYPKAVALGLLNQIILLPIIGYLLAKLIGVDANIAVGIMILAACPGGPTSNLLTNLAKGDVALSVTLTAVNSIVTIFTIPLIVNFGLSQFMADNTTIEAPVGLIMKTLFVVIAIPLIIGMLINKFKPVVAAKMDKPVRIFSAAILIIIILGLILKESDNLSDYFASALLITVILNLATMAVGFFSAKAAKLNFKQALTICIESGNQNGTLAITIATVLLGDERLAVAAAVYSLIMYPNALFPIRYGIEYSKKSKS